MGKAITEKIIARAAGKNDVTPGEFVKVTPDVGPICYAFGAYDPTKFIKQDLEELGVERIKNPERSIIVFDHNQPMTTVADANLYKNVREGVKELGITQFYDRKGIGHVLLVEMGIIRPGMLFMHFEPHGSTLGAIGAFMTDGGRFGGTPLEVYATGELQLRVPESIKFNVTGSFSKGVMSRDLWQHILGDIGPDGALGKVIEYTGPTIEEMDIDGRMTICNPGVFAGAEASIVNPDQKTINYVKKRTTEPFNPIRSDPDAEYAEIIEYDATQIEPMITVPPQVYNTRAVTEVAGREIDQAAIGTCAGGRLEDLRIAAKILNGKQVNERVRMLIIPATQNIFLSAIREGLIEILVAAGAQIYAPTCDICWGKLGTLAAGETSISQQTLNIPGRSGSPEADIYLASAATIAASAVEGKITDPRIFL